MQTDRKPLALAAATLLLLALVPQTQAFHENFNDAHDAVVAVETAAADALVVIGGPGPAICVASSIHLEPVAGGCGGGGGGGGGNNGGVSPNPGGPGESGGTCGNPPASGIRDDDGERDNYVDMDFSDDTAVKRLAIGSLAGKTTATLYVCGKADACGSNIGAAHRLTANGATAVDYDPCTMWSTATYSWAAFSVPLSALTAGTENSFEIVEIVVDWTDRNAFLAVDSDTDNGRSDVHQSSSYFSGSISGELMWSLTLA